MYKRQPFASLEYSQKRKYKDHELTLDSKLLQGGVNLNLSKVYVLTSSTTAAASEMLINCLRPYMTVITIGTTTKGETVATESFPSNQFLWVLRPVVCQVFNSEGEADYTKGFTPNYAVSELSDFAKVLPLGDPNEALFSAAIGIIDGSIVLPEPKMCIRDRTYLPYCFFNIISPSMSILVAAIGYKIVKRPVNNPE